MTLFALVVVIIVGVVGVAVVPDQATQTQIIGFCSLAVLQLIRMLQADRVERKVDKNIVITEKVEKLTNSNSRVDKAAIARLTGKIAQDSGLPEDAREAAEARRDLSDHDAKQAVVDKMEDKTK